MADIFRRALRKLPNRASNDFNDEPEFKTQKVKVIGEVNYYNGNKAYLVKDYNNKKPFIVYADKITFEEN